MTTIFNRREIKLISRTLRKQRDFTLNLLLSQELVEGLTSTLRLAGLKSLLAELLLGESSGVGVESEHNLLVAQRVLLLDVGPLGAGLTLGLAQNGLDFGRVDQTGNVGVSDQVGRQEEVLLESRRSGSGAVNLVQSGESGGGPDDEATKVTTRGELEEVEGEDGGGLNTGDVAESLDKLLAIDLRVVDNQRTTALAVAAATELTLTSTDLLGLLDLNEVGASTDSLEEGNGGLCLGQSSTLEGLRFDNKRDLRDASDTVTTGEQEGRNRGSSQGGSGSEAPV